MHQFFRLRAHGVDDGGMAVSETVDGDARECVDVFFSFDVPYPGAFAM
jgi:hypothetical protein